MTFDVTSLHHRRAANRWDRTSVGDLLERPCWSYPDKEAIVGCAGSFAHAVHERLTYRAANDLANRVANALLARGLKQGDRVLMYCENSVEAYVTKMGIAKAGLVATPLNPALAPDVVEHLIRHLEPRFSFVDAELWPKAEKPFAAARFEPGVTIEIGGAAVPGSTAFADFVRDAPVAEPDVEIHGDDIWQILFTSGTTSMPKGVMLSHTYSYMAGYAFALSLTRGHRFECDLRLLSFLPMIYHVGDTIFSVPPFLCGGTFLIGRRFSGAAVAAAITKERVTALWGGSPAMMGAVAAELARERSGNDGSSLKVAVYGWAALPPAVLSSFKQVCGQDFTAVEIFGQTEAISCYRFWPDKWPELYQRTSPEHNYVGVPNPLLASRIVNLDDRPIDDKPRIAGEAVYRSPAVCAGYYKDEAATRQAFRNGWFHSGDACVYGEGGLRILVDRLKDVIKTGGENVASMRVESVLTQHPDVLTAVVVGLPHPKWGEAVTAFIIPRPGTIPTEEGVMAFSREKLAPFELPKRIIFVDEVPTTVGGKILKYRIRDRNRAMYS